MCRKFAVSNIIRARWRECDVSPHTKSHYPFICARSEGSAAMVEGVPAPAGSMQRPKHQWPWAEYT